MRCLQSREMWEIYSVFVHVILDLNALVTPRNEILEEHSLYSCWRVVLKWTTKPFTYADKTHFNCDLARHMQAKRPFFILLCLWRTVANTINYLVGQHSSGKEHRSQSFYTAKQTGIKAIIVISQSLPIWLLGSLLRRQGSSRPDGALMLAVRRLRSVSLMSNMKSAAEPSLTWDRLLLSSEYIKRNKSQNITRLSAEQVRGLQIPATNQVPQAIWG